MCYTPTTNIIFYVSYTSIIKNKDDGSKFHGQSEEDVIEENIFDLGVSLPNGQTAFIL